MNPDHHRDKSGYIGPLPLFQVAEKWEGLAVPFAHPESAEKSIPYIPGGKGILEQVICGEVQRGTWLHMLRESSVPRLFGLEGSELSFAPPVRPLRILVLTSIRDIAREEHVGEVVHTSLGSHYIKGTVETLLEAGSTSLGRYIQLAGVVTDDHPKDLQGTGYTQVPEFGQSWIHPLGLLSSDGARASEFTSNIPSTYRLLPIHATKERAALKLEFEQGVFDAMQRCGADIILSDSFMGRLQYLISPECFNLFGRVLNIHPGISRGDYLYSCRGKDPARDALLHAQGFHRDHSSGQLLRVTPHCQTGASLHIVSEYIDEGPVLCEEEGVLINPEDSEQEVSVKINLTAKQRVSMVGLAHMAAHLHPDQRKAPFDWRSLVPVPSEGLCPE